MVAVRQVWSLGRSENCVWTRFFTPVAPLLQRIGGGTSPSAWSPIVCRPWVSSMPPPPLGLRSCVSVSTSVPSTQPVIKHNDETTKALVLILVG
jgi:hypothetical protein